MATILQTTTTLTIVDEDFVLLTEYSGAINPNVVFDVLFTVLDIDDIPIEGASIEIELETYTTDVNGQKTISLTRNDYSAIVSMEGYYSQTVTFTIFDMNITKDVILLKKGSFAKLEFDDSFETE